MLFKNTHNSVWLSPTRMLIQEAFLSYLVFQRTVGPREKQVSTWLDGKPLWTTGLAGLG